MLEEHERGATKHPQQGCTVGRGDKVCSRGLRVGSGSAPQSAAICSHQPRLVSVRARVSSWPARPRAEPAAPCSPALAVPPALAAPRAQNWVTGSEEIAGSNQLVLSPNSISLFHIFLFQLLLKYSTLKYLRC